jgi:hypothetical protein
MTRTAIVVLTCLAGILGGGLYREHGQRLAEEARQRRELAALHARLDSATRAALEARENAEAVARLQVFLMSPEGMREEVMASMARHCAETGEQCGAGDYPLASKAATRDGT